MSDSSASQNKPESAFTKLLRERAASEPHSSRMYGNNRPDEDSDSIVNDVLARPTRAENNTKVTSQVENVDASGDIFASYKKERDERERSQSLTPVAQQPAAPVGIVEQDSRSLSRNSVYRRVDGQMTPGRPRSNTRNAQDLPPLHPPLFTYSPSGTYKNPAVEPKDAPIKKSLDAIDGLSTSAKKDPLDFGIKYQSYEKEPVPYKYFATSDPLRYKDQYHHREAENNGTQDDGSSLRLPDGPRPSMETAIYRPSTPSHRMNIPPSESTEMSSTISSNILQPENA